MQDSHRDLMDAFFRCIAVDEEFAGELAMLADKCERDGNHIVSDALRNMSRNHRVRGMEGRAQIAALAVEYSDQSAGNIR